MPDLPVPPHVDVDRITAIARVFAAVDLFHPAVGTDHADAWAAHTAAHLPALLGADASVWQTVAAAWLDGLGDPATTVVAADDVPAASSVIRPATADAVDVDVEDGIVSAPSVATLEGTSALLTHLDAQIAAARTRTQVVLDLRGSGIHADAVLTRLVGTHLVPDGLTLPGLAVRARLSFDPNLLGAGISGPVTIVGDTRHVPAGDAAAPDIGVVVDGDSRSLRLAVAVRDAVGAPIVQVGPVPPAAGTLDLFPLGHGATARVACERLAGVDVRPDVVLSDGSDAEVFAAVRNARPATPGPDPVTPTFLDADPRGADVPVPTWPWRLVGLFRLAGTIGSLYPYLDLLEHDWDELVPTFAAGAFDVTDAAGHWAWMAEAATWLQDSHTTTKSRHVSDARPDVALGLVREGVVVLDAAPQEALSRGDLVLAVDGCTTKERLDEIAVTTTASTAAGLVARCTARLLDGPGGSSARVLVDRDGVEVELVVTRSTAGFPSVPTTTPTVSWPRPDVAFVDVGRLEPADVHAVLDDVDGASVLVLDLRSYPRGTAGHLADAFATHPVDVATITWTEPRAPRHSVARDEMPVTVTMRGSQRVRPTSPTRAFDGRVVALVGTGTVSQGEHTALFLAAATEVTFVGEPSQGANGNAAVLELPGGLRVSFTGVGVTWPDGTQLQRRGVQPDVVAVATLDGLRAGRDEVLEAALAAMT